MKAIICTKYGSVDVLQLLEAEKPALDDDRVLVKVRAASLNVADYYNLGGGVGRLNGGLLKPKDPRVGRDFSGEIEAVGKRVTQFHPGDEVFGMCPGAFAEYAAAREDRIALKPANITHEETSTIAVSGLTALQGLRDTGKIQAGQKVLIDGASGGVGTFAIQTAKAFGAEVTAVVSSRSVEVARSIGADHVIDYTRQDFAQDRQQYDLILGVNGNHSLFAYRRALSPTGRYVMAGASRNYVFFAFIQMALLGRILSREAGRKLGFMGITRVNHPDLLVMSGLLESRKVIPVIDKRFALTQAVDAFRYLAEGHARGKIVLTIQPPV